MTRTELATILVGIGTIIVGLLAWSTASQGVNLQAIQTTQQIQQGEMQKQQAMFENYTYNVEHFPILVSVIGTNVESIKSNNYINYPITATLSFSTVSPDYLEFIINSPRLELENFPCTFSTTPRVELNESQIVKYVDKGVSNENFVIPLLLNYEPKSIPPEKRSDQRIEATPIFFNVTAIDVQNKTLPVVWHHDDVFAVLHITNQSLAKVPC